MRVRLHRNNGSYVESVDLPETEARELHARFFGALHGPQPLSSELTGNIFVSGETHGLPGVFNKGDFAGLDIV